MTSRRMQFAIALAVCSCLFLPACHKGGGGGVGETGPLYINLSIAAAPDNTCQQNNSTSPVPVAGGQSVTYQGATALSQFEVVFPANSTPFPTAVISSPNGSPTSAGTARGTTGTAYFYSSLTINNRTCSNASSLGLIMK